MTSFRFLRLSAPALARAASGVPGNPARRSIWSFVINVSADDPSVLPLDEREEAMWMLQCLLPDEGMLNLGYALYLSEGVDAAELQRAARWVVRRHPMLRSSVQLAHGQPF